ncbi:MAG: hypothetical protein LBC91_02790 [Candidatus Accumulibacter sp.]|jgi:hypothetical protein|nr:hypothetical protein [Accumulibacter sp.]
MVGPPKVCFNPGSIGIAPYYRIAAPFEPPARNRFLVTEHPLSERFNKKPLATETQRKPNFFEMSNEFQSFQAQFVPVPPAILRSGQNARSPRFFVQRGNGARTPHPQGEPEDKRTAAFSLTHGWKLAAIGAPRAERAQSKGEEEDCRERRKETARLPFLLAGEGEAARTRNH